MNCLRVQSLDRTYSRRRLESSQSLIKSWSIGRCSTFKSDQPELSVGPTVYPNWTSVDCTFSQSNQISHPSPPNQTSSIGSQRSMQSHRCRDWCTARCTAKCTARCRATDVELWSIAWCRAVHRALTEPLHQSLNGTISQITVEP